jgi:hypothetical protein
MTSMPDPKPAEEPPPVRTGHGRRVALIAGGAMLVAVVALVAWSARFGGPAPGDEQQPEDVIELIPGPLANRAPSGRRFDPEADSGMPELAEGGRIQSTDADGNLAQEYRFRRLDPNPPGMPANWVHMDGPRAEIYLRHNRVLSLSGDEALAHLPARVMEKGTLTGNVTIRLYEPPSGQVLDLERDEPLLEVRTDQATFDNVIGEVRVAGDFHVETPSLEFKGQGFTMLVNDQNERALFTVEVEDVESVRLARQPHPAGGDSPPAAETDPSPAPGQARSPGRRGRRASQPSEAQEAQFYRLTLHDEVQIRQGPESGLRTATGDALTIVFSSESEGVGPTLAFVPNQRRPASLVGRLMMAFLALPDLSIAPAPSDDDIIITCAGGLTMVPITDPAEMLHSPRDARLTLTGRPVELHDAAQDAHAECDRLVYRALSERVELLGTASQPLSITAPRLAVGGERFWIRRTEGGFTGPGWLETYEQQNDSGERRGPPDTPQLNVRWTDRVDLAFDEATGDGAMGDLRSAAFRGEVTATDADRTMWSDGLDVAFTRATAPSGADVEQVTAAGNIQILLANGARVFADRLDGDPTAESVELTGANLAIAHEQWLIDEGRKLTLDQQTETADWEGPGVARRFRTPMEVSGDRRIAPPVITAEPEARLRWRGSMRYDQAYGDGAGAIDLHGGVTAVSEPSPLERSTFQAQDVTVALAAGDDAADESGVAGRLGRIIARGDAQLERRAWATEDRTDEPRIFFLAGPHLEFDDQTGEGVVEGAGELLMRDLRESDDETDTPSRLGARGTTAFRWQRSLQLTRREGTLYDITMLDGIEMRHLSPDAQTATLTCGRIEATIDRAGETEQASPASDPLSGAVELHRLRAEGSVFLHTSQRDVDCDVFDYDVKAGVAEMSAFPGRFVTIMTVGAPQPVRVQRATWDLKRDEVTVLRGTGGGTR